jgi:hypothetical protein
VAERATSPAASANTATVAATIEVEFTSHGYLVLTHEVAQQFFPFDVLLAMPKGRELWLLPTRGAAAGGLILKQRNMSGDRCVLIREAINDAPLLGSLPAFWDASNGALRVALPITLPPSVFG